MKRFTALALVLAVIGISLPTSALAASQANGQVAGMAKYQGGEPVANYTVRLRNVDSGQIAASATTSGTGEFTFASLVAGNFIVELVDPAGKIIGTSAAVVLTAAQMNVTGVIVTVNESKKVVAAVPFFKSTAGLLVLAAAGGGAAIAIVATRSDASGSK